MWRAMVASRFEALAQVWVLDVCPFLLHARFGFHLRCRACQGLLVECPASSYVES